MLGQQTPKHLILHFCKVCSTATMASSDPHRSTLTESNLEGTVTLRDRRALVPIPEDRSDGASVDFSRITQQKKSWVLANDDKESVVASSTRGVVDERPEASLPRDGDGLSNASGVQKAPRCRISWKIVAIVLLLGIVGIATVLVIARGALMGGNDDSNQNLRGNSPSVPSPTPPTNADELEELNGVLRSFSGDSLFRPGTAQYKARRWIALEDEARVRVRTHGPDRIRQRYSLAVFYFATSGDQWSDQYLNADHECNWDGISCNSGSVVTSLSYRQAGLNGTIPKEVGKIRGLQDIDFSGNALSRGIPKSLFGSPNIKIVRLSDNQLDGKVGSWIWRSSLREVRLRNNSFRGKLPSVPPSRRRYSLSTIDFRDNNFSGTISESWGKLNSSLVGLYLGGNGLTGTIPEWIYDANRLQHLYIPNTNISGTISEKLWKLPNLQKIVLHNNKLSGSIPGVPITASPKVRGCDLSANFLNGTIPPTLFRLSKLEALVLSNNSLTGTIPEVPIPGIMSLWHIGVGRNSLEGSLPSSLWDLPSLESLDVFWNRLNGTIAFPVGTTSLPLKHFWGQMNDFEGMLPTNWSRLLHLGE